VRQTLSASKDLLDLANGDILSVFPLRGVDVYAGFKSAFATFVQGARWVGLIETNFISAAKWKGIKNALVDIICELDVIIFDEQNILSDPVICEETV
jgi:hypothetical protein